MDLRDEVISQALCSRRTVGVCSLPHHRRNARSLPTGWSQARALVEPRCQSSAPCSPPHRPPARSGLCSIRPAGLARLGGGHNPRSTAMAEPNPDTWAQSHMRWLALSRWDNEGGASRSRPTKGSADPTFRHEVRPTPGPVPLPLALEAQVSSRDVGSGQLAPRCGRLGHDVKGRHRCRSRRFRAQRPLLGYPTPPTPTGRAAGQ